MLAGVQSIQHFHLAIAFLTQLDLDRAEAAVVFGEHHQGTLARADDGFAGQLQNLRPTWLVQPRLCGHARAQTAFRVVQLDAYAQRTALWVGLGKYAGERPVDHFPRKGRQPGFDRLPDLQRPGLGFRDGHVQPDALHPIDAGKGLPG
ncbi:hypothetical protein FQZ97_635520 [compost metagenome]